MFYYLIQTFSYASVADVAAVNPNGIKTLLANGLSTIPIKDNPVFSNDPKSLPRNPRNCSILCNWVFDNFTLANELFAKVLWSFETCVLVNNNSCGKLTTTFDEIFKVTSVLFFIPDFNLLSYNLDNITFNVLYWVILYWCYIKVKWIYNTSTVLWEKSQIVSFISSVLKNIFVFPSRSRFLVKLISCIAFGWASSACCLLKSIAINL